MSVQLSPDVARRMLDRWDAQQEAYVAHRELRFRAMTDVLRLHLSEDFTVLDLACGPGSLADRLLTSFPRARAVAVDYDPVLLRLARDVLAGHGERATVLEADLTHPEWHRALGHRRFDAVVTSTALHWLSPPDLVRLYSDLAGLLPPGAVLLNADHLRYGPGTPALRALAAAHDTRTRKAAFATGADTWEAWWAEAERIPGLAALVRERELRFADRPPQADAPLALHLAALATAGFAETGTVWQYLDDYVVFARR